MNDTPDRRADCVMVASDGGYECSVCGFRWPRPLRRECRQGAPLPPVPPYEIEQLQRNRRLTLKGKLLICLPPPGDATAVLTKYTGIAALAKAWEQISGQPCGCGDRQAWMNAAWQRFVWQHFSAPCEAP